MIPMSRTIRVFAGIFVMTFVFLCQSAAFCQTESVLWSEDWEGDWTVDWHVDGGTWEVGEPTSGPGGAFDSLKCAATVLAGNYSDNVDHRLIRHKTFVVPPSTDNPRLRFWQWHSYSHNDNGRVQVKVGSGDWTTISEIYTYTSCGIWTRPFVDLSAYADSTVQVAFYLHSRSDYNVNVSSGWYIDNVEVVTGPITPFDNPENWESGIDQWTVDFGIWEVGTPSSGPGSAFAGDHCAGTVLDGNYCDNRTSRLISPSFVVPSDTDNPRLRFWHWHSFSHNDNGRVDIRVGAGDWTTVSEVYTYSSCGIWTRPSVDLSAYADSTVQVAFYFSSQSDYNINEGSGWYIDEVEIETGPINPFDNPEDWESGIDQWVVDMGIWQIGEPLSGPGAAHAGNYCAATILDGNYCDNRSSRLISPPFTVPQAADNPRLRFWHWYSFSHNDHGYLEIKTENGDWTQISDTFTYSSCGMWTRSYVDLAAYGDSTVQLAFYFHSESDYNINEGNGWYIDDVELVAGPYHICCPEDWEHGFDYWAADNSLWQVGRPTYGPSGAHSDSSCAGTILDGEYCDNRDSRLISPPFVVPDAAENPALRFWHWFSFAQNDYGEVQIKAGQGGWESISSRFAGTSSGVWSPDYLPLILYANMTVRIAFFFHSQSDYNINTDAGWYIDDITFDGFSCDKHKCPTVLQAYTVDVGETWIELDWILSEAGQKLAFRVFRECVSDGRTENIDLPGRTENGLAYRYRDSKLAPNNTYRYTVISMDEEGTQTLFTTDLLSLKNLETALNQNHPNPFNPVTAISYSVGKINHVSLNIYDTKGTLIRILHDAVTEPGRYEATWDGRDNKGGRVASGVYFYRLVVGNRSLTRKMILLK